MSYKDKLKPVGTISQTPPPTGKSYMSKLQPVSGEEQQEPGFVQSVAQGLASPFLKFGATVKDVGRGIGALFGGAEAQREYLQSAPSTIDAGYLGQQKAMQTPLEGLGVGIEAGSTFLGGGGVRKVAQTGLKGLIKEGFKTGIKEGAKYGGASSFGQALQAEKPTIGSVLGQTAVGTIAGGFGGGALGGAVPIISKGVRAFLPKTPAVLKTELDQQIKNIYKGETMGVAQLNERALKARKGLELLQKESPNIKVPDPVAPLGSKATKPIDLQRATPNELLSGVLEMDKKIASVARKATEKAQQKGVKIDTSDVQGTIKNAIDGAEVPKATGQRMLKQIERLENDPLKIHDWIQDINIRYGKKYERKIMDDTQIGKLADDVAEVLRGKLNNIVDRKGYAEAFGNNQELKRMLVVMAKKANRGVNFGDITTDVGLDAAISLLTGNPAFMARTLATGGFRALINGLRNTAGIRTFKKALKISEKLGTTEKLPSSRLKMPRAFAPTNKTPTQSSLPTPKLEESYTKTLPQSSKISNLGTNTSLRRAFDEFKKSPKGALVDNPASLIRTADTVSDNVMKIIGAKKNTVSFTRRSLKHLAEKGDEGERLLGEIPGILKTPDEIRKGDLAGRFFFVKAIKDKGGRPHTVKLEVTKKDGNIIVTAFQTDSKYLSDYELLWRTGVSKDTVPPSRPFGLAVPEFSALKGDRTSIVPRTPKKSSFGREATIPKSLEPLAAEARKYKSAEEFVKKQIPVYHGSPVPLKKFSNKKGGVFFTDEYTDAIGFAGSPDNVYEGYLNFKKPLVIDAKGAKWDNLNTKYGTSTQEVISNAEKEGYDGVTFKNIIDNVMDDADAGSPNTIHYAYKPQDSFINESQLTDFYNQAVKKSNFGKPK